MLKVLVYIKDFKWCTQRCTSFSLQYILAVKAYPGNKVLNMCGFSPGCSFWNLLRRLHPLPYTPLGRVPPLLDWQHQLSVTPALYVTHLLLKCCIFWSRNILFVTIQSLLLLRDFCVLADDRMAFCQREFYLEGGAMVLADGGVVCIDEFDKMRPEDRCGLSYHVLFDRSSTSIIGPLTHWVPLDAQSCHSRSYGAANNFHC